MPARSSPTGSPPRAARRARDHDRALLDIATKETLDLCDGRFNLYAALSYYLRTPKLMARLEGEHERAKAEVKRQEQVFFQYREWAQLSSKFASCPRSPDVARARGSLVDSPEAPRPHALAVVRIGSAVA